MRRLTPRWTRRREWDWVYRQAKAGGPDATPGKWHLAEVSSHVRDAFDMGWFVPGQRVLDIGCGLGENAAWLAENDCRVMGIDFSDSAIEQARLKYEYAQGLEFSVADCTQSLTSLGSYDSALDRGCLQGLPPHQWKYWFQNVHRVLQPSGRVLLLMAIKGRTDERLLLTLNKLGRSMFRINDYEAINMLEYRSNEAIAGLKLYLEKA